MTDAIDDDKIDAEADATIRACLNLSAPKSFLLYAGAGSGKTRSLVEAIRHACRHQGNALSKTGQKIGVITYTNAACDEIKQRLEFDPRVEVSTIHAFAWFLISGYDNDIRKWVAGNLTEDISELEQQQLKGRASTKAASDRARSIENKRRRLSNLNGIKRFIYSPTGDNRTRDSLNHAEVIAMTSEFLTMKPGLRQLVTTRFPILLIDESQDTARPFMEAILNVQSGYVDTFCLGLFGDTMQRIYADGKERLAEAIPAGWARPRKVMNHRCPVRIVTLINKIREDDDGQEQRPRSDAKTGVIRLFLAPETVTDPSKLEADVAKRMAIITGDDNWGAGNDKIKTLALEHMMSARRFGFEAFFAPLYGFDRMRTSLLEGTGGGIGFFIRELLPLTKALAANDRFAIAASIRRTSPILDRDRLQAAGQDQRKLLDQAKTACDGLRTLLFNGSSPSLRSVLKYVAETDLFSIPDVLLPFSTSDHEMSDMRSADDEEGEDAKTETGAWRLALEAPFDQVEKYDHYVRGISQFDTHQGVKGLEFPRVMVVISDEEARGFMFSYGKLMGIKPKTKGDLENEAAGRETSIDRTRRLFYVTCSRAKESLAIVYYSDNAKSARDHLIARGWFSDDEIELVS
ncbi:DNA helicase-2 / ATP-dependent DNA helicase PcrA [Bradyrhizobium yuanmingense]|uniref:DNA 3'-5' helicase II n=2 Tax=Bradyrhizobium yuanmingense TaxID=108015 RepID=A0A1C3UDK6_9BRAD|nr:UvrD-helicase domain-containing protein [Bradyrhizobium yuanmingense]TWI20797.1 DNA helicase-2/ATP-dependent DNA helicase PcrA [Bradyrhizobium yuanmingense]SCB13606.1 DNA helicase-2 / ATP-dependent DNA helicase PcrA [Bradyrhizobium yuanmingense]